VYQSRVQASLREASCQIKDEKRLLLEHLGFPGIFGHAKFNSIAEISGVAIALPSISRLSVSERPDKETMYGFSRAVNDLTAAGLI
jgi:hypothetical protein